MRTNISKGKHVQAHGRQAETERKLNYQCNYRAGDLPPELPVNHYSIHLHRPYTPGVGGAPPDRINTEALAYDWQASLSQMHATAALLSAKCGQELHHVDQHIVPGDTLAMRRAVNYSLETQMAYFTHCMAAWAGGPPLALQQLQQALSPACHGTQRALREEARLQREGE